MKVEELIPEIHALTTSIYYKELQKLVNYLMTIPPSERKKYRVICKESINRECERITDFFNVKLLKSNALPENHLIICVNYYELRKDLGWL
jgi:hypothetical protein